MDKHDPDDLLRPATAEDRKRLDAIWNGLFDDPNHQAPSAQNRMEIWKVEHQVRSDRLVSARLTKATWVLVIATIVLAIATVALVWDSRRTGCQRALTATTRSCCKL